MKITDINGTVKLRNGVQMPYFGLGVFKINDEAEVIRVIRDALEIGYRHFDTASLYGNERGVGRAIKSSGILRKQTFVTSKVWNSDQGYDSTLRAFDTSIKLLGFEYLDLYLIHWPVQGKYNATWKAVERLYTEGCVRAIGVSNFLRHHLDDLLTNCSEIPMVNQMEFHPYLVQQDLIDYCNDKNIQYEAWSPLMQGKIFEIPELQVIAAKYGKDIAQIVLRWNLQKGVVTIPKSVRKERITSNAQIFDFEIAPEDTKIIDRLDKSVRVGADPDNFNF
jgi:diketogulonate reductase-like aldo/keto reductase